MRKIKVKTPDGKTKKVTVSRVGLVTWNGVSGEIKIDADDAYLAQAKALAGLMLVGDQVNNIATARAELYPSYGNPNVTVVVLSVVNQNLGTSKAHDPASLQPWLESLGKTAKDMGLLDDITPKPTLVP